MVVDTYRIQNAHLHASVTEHGAAITDLHLHAIDHPMILTCGMDARMASRCHYIGPIVGPIANRVANGRHAIDGTEHRLDQNEGTTCLHGGAHGLSERAWSVTDQAPDSITLAITLTDQLGVAGAMTLTATYTLDGPNLVTTLCATAEQPNMVNLASHLYFNLNTDPVVDRHKLQIGAAQYLPTDAQNIPTGQIADITATPFDFRAPREIGDTFMDMNFCLDETQPNLILTGTTGISMELRTNQAGVQIYTADHFDGTLNNIPARAALAIEPQGWPNAVNEPTFPSQLITPDRPYLSQTTYRFAAPNA